MAIDKLHTRIRRFKNPSIIDFGIEKEGIPPHILEQEPNYTSAYRRFCAELLEGLSQTVPGVRFSFDTFALLGAEGLQALSDLLKQAQELEYYVFLDGPGIYSPWGADRAAEGIFGNGEYPCDCVIICPYIGTDAAKPFMPYVKDIGKDLFLIVRSANKSALEIQDLYTGSRFVHSAAGEMVNRLGEGLYEKCGYSRVGAAVSATAVSSVKTLRSAFNRMFLLMDGVDYPSGNFKNASFGFDQFGYGCAVCAGPSVTCAWVDEENSLEYVTYAKKAADNMKKNILRYITVL